MADSEVSGNFTTMIHKIHQGNPWSRRTTTTPTSCSTTRASPSSAAGSACARPATTARSPRRPTTTRAAEPGCPAAPATTASSGAPVAVRRWPTSRRRRMGPRWRPPATWAGEQADDSKCGRCHTEDIHPVDHRMENLTKNNPAILPGLAAFQVRDQVGGGEYHDQRCDDRVQDLKGVAPGGAGVCRPRRRRPGDVPGASVNRHRNPLTVSAAAPGFLLAYAMPQDGITSPVDYNNLPIKQSQPISVSIAALLNTATSATSANTTTVGSLAGPDGSGYYTATLRGNGSAVCGGSTTLVPCVFPVGPRCARWPCRATSRSSMHRHRRREHW